jgi:starch phosphorylase
VGYKRPALLLHDPDRLERLLTRADRPVQIVVAGKAHPDDTAAAALITAWIDFAARPAVRDHVVFLEDYDITLAEEMVRGVDVWLNTPRRPWEACGTSGMKVLANGGLNASTLDGWWAEAYDDRIGWRIGTPDAALGDDAADAARLYELLERQIVPEFYSRDASGLPSRWLERVRASMAELAPRFSANRMVREYVTNAYLPAAALARTRECDGGRAGKELLAWQHRLARDWHAIHFGRMDVAETAGRRTVSVPVYLGALEPSDVAVELYADPVSGTEPECVAMTHVGELPGAVNGGLYQVSMDATRPITDYTPRVVPSRAKARVPIEAWLIAWYR